MSLLIVLIAVLGVLNSMLMNFENVNPLKSGVKIKKTLV